MNKSIFNHNDENDGNTSYLKYNNIFSIVYSKNRRYISEYILLNFKVKTKQDQNTNFIDSWRFRNSYAYEFHYNKNLNYLPVPSCSYHSQKFKSIFIKCTLSY